jgi:ubiquinone/menaquinone biosynthesis C-methylase UbiE
MTQYLYDSAYLDTVQNLLSATKRRSYELLNVVPGDRIFDIGCGNGKDAAALAAMGAAVLGIDCHPDFIEEARQLMRTGLRLDFLRSDADLIAVPAESVDKVRFDRVFQHLENPAAVLIEAKRLLKPGGMCQVVDVDYFRLKISSCDAGLQRAIVDSIASERIPNAHNVRELPAMLADCGFVVTEIEEDPFVVEDYATAQYLIRFDRVVEQLSRRGRITEKQYEQWKHYADPTEATFRLVIPLVIIMARKSRLPSIQENV